VAVADPGLFPAAWAALRPGGRLVANVVSLEGERAVLDWQARQGGELTRIALSRPEQLGGYHAWRPLLPVTQLAATKPG
jgi:precorrin-6Y C5,15-methyltransferase (decarboxylating)